MDPSFKELFERLTTGFDEMRRDMRETTTVVRAQSAKMDEFAAWRPETEARVSNLSEAVASLGRGHLGEEVAAPLVPPHPRYAANDDLIVGDTGMLRAPHGSADHGDPGTSRERAPGGFVIPAPLPANGQFPFQSPVSVPSPFAHASQLLAGIGQAHPAIGFPQLDGENPTLWKILCEQYFQMFAIHSTYWVPMASLNLSGAAAVWLQSVQKKLASFTWESFTAVLFTRFGRDKHQLLIRQFYTIHQSSSVSEYIERFETITNHLTSYYFLTRFVEGLRLDIHAVVLVQRPPDLDTACSLALLQEEVASMYPDMFRAPPWRLPAPPRRGVPLPLPPPPARLQLTAPPPAVAPDRRAPDPPQQDLAKLKALREYWRAKGLCFKCGERWGHDHVCPNTVQLHVVEELLELFELETIFEPTVEYVTDTSEETVFAISRQALDGSSSPKAVQLHAWLQGAEVLILIDSGSTTSFVNQSLAPKLHGICQLDRSCRVHVADGAWGL